MRLILLPICLIALNGASYSQSTDTNIPAAPKEAAMAEIDAKTLSRLSERYENLSKSIQKRTDKALTTLQKQELGLQKTLAHKDSSKSQLLFTDAQKEYRSLQTRLQSPVSSDLTNPLKEYIPNVDSLSTALKFLRQKGIDLPADKLQQVQALSDRFRLLQGRMQQANEVQAFIQQREQQLKSQLSNYGGGVGSQLLGMNKQVYYYQEQLAQYKETLKDPEKVQTAVMTAVGKMPGFQHFMAKNSFLSQLFPASPNYGTPKALTGLQTMSDVKQQLQDRFGKSALTPGTSGGGSPLEQQLQSAQTAL